MTYRINGFKQIEAFYSIVFSGVYDITPQHISLYMFLLNQNNRANWVEWFKCPYDLAMNGAMIGSKKTYYKCLNELKDWNLIDYIAGENQFKAPKISLLRLENAPQLIPQCEPASEPLLIPACEPLPTTARVRYINYISNNFNKLITNNLKQLQEGDFDFENFFVVTVKKRNNEKPKVVKPKPTEIVFPFDSEKFMEAWGLWKVYKKEQFKFTYQTIGEQAALKDLSELANGDETKAIELIHHAISKSWKGIYPKSKNNKNGTTKEQRPILAAALEVLRNAGGEGTN